MDIQTFLAGIALFLNKTLFPFMLAIAGIVFLWNVARYFIIGGANAENQEKARTLALWGIIAFVFILSLWGIVNLLVPILKFGGNNPITPDYMQSRGVLYTNGSVQYNDNSAPGETPSFNDDSAPGETPGFNDDWAPGD